MPQSEFVYVTYIKTTPDQLWKALIDPEVMKQWRFRSYAESDWSGGSSWQMVTNAGQIIDTGEIVASNPPTRLVFKWRNEWQPELKAKGYSPCTFDIEPVSSTGTELIARHSIDGHPSQFIEAVSEGWPRRSLLEIMRQWVDTPAENRHG